MAEGWLLSERDDGRMEIQRYDDCIARSDSLEGDGLPPFDTDGEAEAYVRRMAAAGSAMHTAAIHQVDPMQDASRAMLAALKHYVQLVDWTGSRDPKERKFQAALAYEAMKSAIAQAEAAGITLKEDE